MIEWVVGSVERGVGMQLVRPFPRASSSAVHGIDVERTDGGVERLALRRYVFPEVLASEPDPAWDLIDAVDALPDLDDSASALRRLDDWVATRSR